MDPVTQVVLGLIVVVALSYLVTIYNGLIRVKNNIEKAWANIDVLLKQRHDEVPKLIAVCEGYMTHERGALELVLQARSAMMGLGAQPAAVAVGEAKLAGALKGLFEIAESYPELKAKASFQQLQTRISGLESEIADRREFYNESVNSYNIRIESLPDIVVARNLGMKRCEMFQVVATDREDVKIEFKNR